jgi:hypothetical protein
MKKQLKVGVLIIGSLYWDDHQADQLNLRKRWRQMRLSMKYKLHVKAPIRYGRLSGQTYTMVLSRNTEIEGQLGTAYFVPAKRACNSFNSLVKHAEFLSEAENAADKNLVKGRREKWCAIGLLFNPRISSVIKENMLSQWQRLLEASGLGDWYSSFKIGNEESIISASGEILINWLQTVDARDQSKLDHCDIVIAVCTRANLEAYPTSKTVAENARQDLRHYFYNNIKHGISTFQDNEILNA